jgi:hypothetical protein
MDSLLRGVIFLNFLVLIYFLMQANVGGTRFVKIWKTDPANRLRPTSAYVGDLFGGTKTGEYEIHRTKFLHSAAWFFASLIVFGILTLI